MGLEGVEIILGVEEAFGVEIPQSVAGTIRTPQQLIDYIFSQLPSVSSEHCVTQRLFHRLRRGVLAVVPDLEQRFTPDTLISSFATKQEWPRVWSEVRERAGEPFWPERVPWSGFFSGGPKTVRQLVRLVANSSPLPSIETKEPWTREQVSIGVRRVIREVTGHDDFKEKASFVDDLGVS
jgi:acyl carrier protein